jgi:hypothetical protein
MNAALQKPRKETNNNTVAVNEDMLKLAACKNERLGESERYGKRM